LCISICKIGTINERGPRLPLAVLAVEQPDYPLVQPQHFSINTGSQSLGYKELALLIKEMNTQPQKSQTRISPDQSEYPFLLADDNHLGEKVVADRRHALAPPPLTPLPP
jgi:hypothetical protein